MAGNSDAFENIITFLVIIFFVIRSLLKKPARREVKGKTPYKPVQPMTERLPRKDAGYQKAGRPADLKSVLADVLKNFEENLKEAQEASEKKSRPVEVRTPEAVQPEYVKIGADMPEEQYEGEGPVVPLKKRVEKKAKPGEKKVQPKRAMSLALFFDRNEMQRAVIMSEILQKPLSMRGRYGGSDLV